MDLTQPQVLRPFLDRHGLFAKKALGQHFLCSSKVVLAIRSRVEGMASALEVGPGPGVLTSVLCDVCEHVTAIELDERMVAALAESAPCAKVLRMDALKADLDALLKELPGPRALVSNIPYNITGPLLTKFAACREHYDKAVLMMQREVAWRVMAPEHSPHRGSLSVFLQVQFEISKVVDAPPGAFMPPPKVDSTVLQLVPRTDTYDPKIEPDLFELIRIGFKQPRKTLANNLMAGYGVDRGAVDHWMASLALEPMLRPQQIQNDVWLRMATVVASLKAQKGE